MQKQIEKIKKVNTGIEGLDEMFNGGFIKGSVTLLAGHSGTGKTLFSLQFIKEGLRANERCLYISLTESPSRTLKFYDILNVDWEVYMKKKKFILFSSRIFNIGELIPRLEELLGEDKIERMVIDGFPAPYNFMNNKRIFNNIDAILNKLKQEDITVIITSDISEETKYFGLEDSYLPGLVDNIIIIRQIEVESEILKVLTILKARGSIYDNRIRELKLDNSGLCVKDIIEGYKDVLSTTPTPSEISLYISYGKFEDEVIDKFNKKYPNIIVRKTEEISSVDKLSLITSSNTTLGVSSLGYYQLYKLAKDGLLMKLNDLIDDKNLYFDKSILASSFEGNIYGVPEDVYCRSLIYRRDLLEKYGISVPKTWNELIEASKFILKKENNSELIGILYYCGNTKFLADVFLEFVWSNGGNVYDKEGNVSINDERVLEALNLMQDLIYKHKIMPKEVISYNGEDIKKKFLEGKVIFLKFMPYIMQDIYNSDSFLKDKVWLAPLPKMDKGDKGYGVIDGTAFIIPKNTKYPKSASQFLKFFTDIKIARSIELRGGYPFPSRVPFWEDKEILLQKPYYIEADKILECCRIPYLEIKNYDLMSLLIQKRVFQVLNREKKPEEALEILSTDIKKLKRHKVYQRVVENVINYLERNYSKRIFLEDISKTVKLSQEYLSRIFKFQTGMTIFDYLIKIRIEKSQEFLKDVKYNIKEI